MVAAPKTERARSELLLPLSCRDVLWQISGLLLPQMIAHIDRQRKHIHQRGSCVRVGDLGGDLTPIGRYPNAVLCHDSSRGSQRYGNGQYGFQHVVTSVQVFVGGAG
jgi:hypothetical protein